VKNINLQSSIELSPKTAAFLGGGLPWLIGFLLLPVLPPLILTAPLFSAFFLRRYEKGFGAACLPTALAIFGIWLYSWNSGAAGDAGMGMLLGSWYFSAILVAMCAVGLTAGSLWKMKK
jgi:hypothetical protein